MVTAATESHELPWEGWLTGSGQAGSTLLIWQGPSLDDLAAPYVYAEMPFQVIEPPVLAQVAAGSELLVGGRTETARLPLMPGTAAVLKRLPRIATAYLPRSASGPTMSFNGEEADLLHIGGIRISVRRSSLLSARLETVCTALWLDADGVPRAWEEPFDFIFGRNNRRWVAHDNSDHLFIERDPSVEFVPRPWMAMHHVQCYLNSSFETDNRDG